MNSWIYIILLDDIETARCTTMDIAIIIAKGLMNEYYNEPNLAITIKREIEKV